MATTTAKLTEAAAEKLAAPATTAPGWVELSLCSDTCPAAQDGVCQEGRRSMHRSGSGSADGPLEVLCDLGTDCFDCGPWQYTGPEEASRWTPIRDIMAKQVRWVVCVYPGKGL